jgi:hypothetical protein
MWPARGLLMFCDSIVMILAALAANLVLCYECLVERSSMHTHSLEK